MSVPWFLSLIFLRRVDLSIVIAKIQKRTAISSALLS
jgi:hypothetical protein